MTSASSSSTPDDESHPEKRSSLDRPHVPQSHVLFVSSPEGFLLRERYPFRDSLMKNANVITKNVPEILSSHVANPSVIFSPSFGFSSKTPSFPPQMPADSPQNIIRRPRSASVAVTPRGRGSVSMTISPSRPRLSRKMIGKSANPRGTTVRDLSQITRPNLSHGGTFVGSASYSANKHRPRCGLGSGPQMILERDFSPIDLRVSSRRRGSPCPPSPRKPIFERLTDPGMFTGIHREVHSVDGPTGYDAPSKGVGTAEKGTARVLLGFDDALPSKRSTRRRVASKIKSYCDADCERLGAPVFSLRTAVL